MKKIFLTILFSLTVSLYSQEYNGLYCITKIILTDDGDTVLFIKNKNIKGIIVMDNKEIIVDSSFIKTEINRYYYFKLEVDQIKYRGKNDGYGIISSNGKVKRIWDVKKNGKLPYIFKALNLKGLYIKNKE